MTNKHDTHKAEIHDLLLSDYASGDLCGGESALIASYLTLNPAARESHDAIEAVGGMVMDDIEPVAIEESCLNNVLSCIALPQKTKRTRQRDVNPLNCSDVNKVPQPIREYALSNRGRIILFPTSMSTRRAVISTRACKSRAELLCMNQDVTMPAHEANEIGLMLILDGGCINTITNKVYERGDLIIVDVNRPQAFVTDPQRGCLCFRTRAHPMSFSSKFLRTLNLFKKR